MGESLYFGEDEREEAEKREKGIEVVRENEREIKIARL